MISTPSGGETVFKMRGFSYSNARIGEGAPGDASVTDTDSLMKPRLCKRDFDGMRAVNANAIKVYAFNVVFSGSKAAHQACLDYAWNNGVKPIFIELSIWIGAIPFPDSTSRVAMLSNYAKMVQETADHPAVMSYAVGSEFSGDPNAGPTSPYWTDFKAVASTIRQNMGNNKKLITTAVYQTTCTSPTLCPKKVLDLGHVINGEAAGAEVDFWGVDIYSPDPGTAWLRESIFKATKKPFVLPEYGLTYQPSMTPNSAAKAVQELVQVKQVETNSFASGRDGNDGSTFDANAPIYAGALLFEWHDEYWKAAAPGSNGLPCAAGLNSAQPWYGKNALALKPGCACVAPEQRSDACYMDDLVPRAIMSQLTSAWTAYEPAAYDVQLTIVA